MSVQTAVEAPALKTATVQLARGIQTFPGTPGDITLYEGDVSGFRTVRLAVTAYVENGGLMIKVFDVEDPARPIVLAENVAETAYQELRTTLDLPGRRMAVRIWVDETGGHDVQVTWGIWGRPD
jgi:hypothetical protein